MCFLKVFLREPDTNKDTVSVENKQIMHSNAETDNEQKHDDVTHEQSNRKNEEIKDVKETENDNYVREELNDSFLKKKD